MKPSASPWRARKERFSWRSAIRSIPQAPKRPGFVPACCSGWSNQNNRSPCAKRPTRRKFPRRLRRRQLSKSSVATSAPRSSLDRSLMMNNRRTTHTIALVLLVIMVLPPPMARAQTAARSENAVGASASIEQLTLLVGRSVVIRTDRPITRVSLSTPDIADALVTMPYELLVHGKAPGTISLLVWSDNGKIKTYDVAVRRDLSALDDQMHKLFPHEAISVASNGKDVVLY